MATLKRKKVSTFVTELISMAHTQWTTLQ